MESGDIHALGRKDFSLSLSLSKKPILSHSSIKSLWNWDRVFCDLISLGSGDFLSSLLLKISPFFYFWKPIPSKLSLSLTIWCKSFSFTCASYPFHSIWFIYFILFLVILWRFGLLEFDPYDKIFSLCWSAIWFWLMAQLGKL